MKYLLVSGGVISGIGKGIIASSSGLLLKTSGLRVTTIKIDPYLNQDAGLMSPLQHGECFVLESHPRTYTDALYNDKRDDSGETDLDLGNYERYLSIRLTKAHNITTGKVYQHVIDRERKGDYLGMTVQVVPHITDCIQDWIENVAKVPVDESGKEPDVCIIELGGTVGDIESAPFVEALVQLRHRAGRGNFANIHVSYVPVIGQEQKTKPTQHAVKNVRSAGLIPDLIACRCEDPLDQSTISKIANACQVDLNQVIAVRDMETTYQVPMLLDEQGLTQGLGSFLQLTQVEVSNARVAEGKEVWKTWIETTTSQRHWEAVNITLVGKYVELHDAYISVVKSLEHSAMRCKRRLNLIWVDAEHLEDSTRTKDPATFHKAWHDVCTASGVLVPGAFGGRGTEGMIAAAKWAREQKTPYLGICMGMQTAVLEYSRNVAGISEAMSEEFHAQAKDKVIIFMPEIDRTTMGGNMRLGKRTTLFQQGSEWSKLRAMYGGVSSVDERHRHRYEVNPEYVERLENLGLHFIGKDEKGERMEIVELRDHPYFVGVQYHGEYLSRVLAPSPPSLGFVAASAGCLEVATRQQQQWLASKAPQVNGVNGSA